MLVPEFLAYHDREWGFPVVEDIALFEKLCLESVQSGLNRGTHGLCLHAGNGPEQRPCRGLRHAVRGRSGTEDPAASVLMNGGGGLFMMWGPPVAGCHAPWRRDGRYHGIPAAA